ncbi:MAG: aminoglycoside phosphotransferase family protein, partial [Pseudomonadales bacterium]|nr:aminoglycoside phosphotransferase family protein [Pseudomonadales bacterium]
MKLLQTVTKDLPSPVDADHRTGAGPAGYNGAFCREPSPLPFESVSTVLVARLLANAGFDVSPTEVDFERRGERWRATVPGEHVVWIAASVEGRRLLSKERQVLKLIRQSCEFRVPEILYEDPSADFDVRTMVPGIVHPEILIERQKDTTFLRNTGTEIGSMLAQQHTRIEFSAAGVWLPPAPGWPRSSQWIVDRLPEVTGDRELIGEAVELLRRYEDVRVEDADRVLIHGDVGAHNLAIDAASGHVHGIFDYGDAAWADRHHDFRYLTNETLLRAALAAYEPVTGRRIDRQ